MVFCGNVMNGSEDNRKHVRAGLIAEIQYVCDSTVLKARISDISIGGLFIDTINPLELGKTVRFSITVPREISEKPIPGEGVVSWRQEMMGMGLRFTRMGREDWEKIKKYMAGLPG